MPGPKANRNTMAYSGKNRSRLWRLFRDGAIVIAISASMFIFAEIFLRVFFPQQLSGTSIQGEQFSMEDPVLGMRYVPNAHWRFTHPEYTAEYSIDADGFRNAQQPVMPKPEGTTRVLLLGDSFTFGQGVNYEDNWPVIAETALAASGRHHIELVNAGIQGLDQRSELILMEELVPKYDPDVIVVVFLINDLYANSLYGITDEKIELKEILDNGIEADPERSWIRTMQQTYISNRRHGDFYLLSLLRRMLLANERLYPKLYLSSARGDFMREPWTAEVAQQVKITEILFTKMHQYAQSKGKQLIVFSLPQQFQVLYPRYPDDADNVDVAVFDKHFSEVANAKGFTWVSTLETFAAAEEPGKLFYRWDGHFTAAGNRVAAEVFVREIAPLLQGKAEAEVKVEAR